MSDTSRTDASAPSLSSYPPAFVSLITTFIQRAEEAETRAHKALVILKSKDQKIFQLMKRMEILEKIATRLEDVMVPPLELPSSPDTEGGEGVDPYHPRDSRPPAPAGRRQSPHVPLETLYERYPTLHRQRMKEEGGQEVHNCYTRCQHLIDGLERSNCQLREALTEESQQRVRDHEEYVGSLARVTQAVRELQADRHSSLQKTGAEYAVLQSLYNTSFSKALFEDPASRLPAAGDNKGRVHLLPDENKQMALVDKEGMKEKVDMAESIIKILQSRLEKGVKTSLRRIISKRRGKATRQQTSRSSFSTYHTPQSSVSLKTKPKYRSVRCLFSSLKRKNKKLKLKYKHVYEKFKESLDLCGKLKDDIVELTEQKKAKMSITNAIDNSTQTDKLLNCPVSERPEKPQNSRSVHILQGRLDAASKVMAKQCKQVQGLQQQLVDAHSLTDSLRKRLSRAESSLAAKERLWETIKTQLQDSEDKNAALTQEVHQLKESVNHTTQEFSFQVEMNKVIETQKENSERKFEEMKRTLESKLFSLSITLQEKDLVAQQATGELEAKLSCLKEQFVAQVTEASDRLVAADSKIQELYLGIETFLKLLFSVNRTSTPRLSPSSQAHAVQMASDILELAPGQIHTILNSSRYDNYLANKWIRECNRLVHANVFAKNLGHFLLEAVLEARLS